MAKKPVSPLQTITSATGKAVRFYFELALTYVLPLKPARSRSPGRRSAVSEDEWNIGCCESLCMQLQDRLTAEYDPIRFKTYERLSSENNVFKIVFAISKCHEFSASDIFTPRKERTGFKIKARPLAKALESIRSHIHDRFCNTYYVSDLSLKFLTSRDFVFQIYFSGTLVVEREFTPAEIRENEGVVNTLEHFNDDISSDLEHYGFGISPESTLRRTRNNRYTFEVDATRYFGFGENEVVGDLALLEKNASAYEVASYGIDNSDAALDSRISDLKLELGNALESLPEGVKLIGFEFSFVDQDDDVVEVRDELIAS